MSEKTVIVILEYCGGAKTDLLFEKITRSNKGYKTHVLDNASPSNASKYVTVRNPINSYVGGGIRDSLALAEREGAKYLFFVSNDIDLIRVPCVEHFESLAELDDSVILVGGALTADSCQAPYFTWMVDNGLNMDRIVPHYDPLCCLVRIDFIREFGGLPQSIGGWGYDLEIASYAKFRNRKIVISDSCLLRHRDNTESCHNALGPGFSKKDEMKLIYDSIYGDYRVLYGWRGARRIPELERLFGPSSKGGPKHRLDPQACTRLLEELPQEIIMVAR